MVRRATFWPTSAWWKIISAVSMLELSDITVRYGPFLAVDNVGLHVDAGEIVGLVGPNGAGKSSLVKTVGGVVRPMAGRVMFEGLDLANVPTHERICLGLSVVPE